MRRRGRDGEQHRVGQSGPTISIEQLRRAHPVPVDVPALHRSGRLDEFTLAAVQRVLIAAHGHDIEAIYRELQVALTVEPATMLDALERLGAWAGYLGYGERIPDDDELTGLIVAAARPCVEDYRINQTLMILAASVLAGRPLPSWQNYPEMERAHVLVLLTAELLTHVPAAARWPDNLARLATTTPQSGSSGDR